MKRKKLIICIIILLVTVLITKEINDYLPYVIGGHPIEVFGINNMDSINHSVNIQVLDSNNILLVNETYELGYSQKGEWVPEKQSVRYPENGWESVYDRDNLFPKGDYTFIITLDNNVTQTFQGELDRWTAASISIDNNGNLNVGRVAE